MHSPLLPSLAILTALIVVLRFLWTYWRDAAFAAAHGCLPPPRLSRWTNIRQQLAARQTHSWLSMWCMRYNTVGTTFSSASVTPASIIFTNDPENLKTILATGFSMFELGDRRRKLLGPLVGTGVFTADGKAWEHSRSLIRPAFNKMQISDVSFFEPHVQDLLSVLPMPNSHTGLIEVDLQPLFFRMTLDSSSELLLGRSFRSLKAAEDSVSWRFMEAFDYAQLKVHTRDLLERGWIKPVGLAYQALRGWRKDRFDKACETVHSLLDDIITKYLAESKEGKTKPHKYVFLEELSQVTNDPLQLRFEVLNVLLAGRDTTASLLSNVFFVLARRPDIWAAVRSEVLDTFGQKLPEYSALRNMKQLRNLINECLRLYPPVPFNARCATTNTVLPRGGGPDGRSPVFVRAGQAVDYHVFALHRSPQIFGPDADVCRPGRWDDPSLRPGWGYLPFNGGPRICLGQQFALTEVSYTVVRLLQHFSSIERRDVEMEWTERVALVVKSRRGTKVAMMPCNR